MTNRNMVKGNPDAPSAPRPNTPPLPPMPAAEGSPTPATRTEPVDSPQPNASAKRDAPAEGEHGLSTER